MSGRPVTRSGRLPAQTRRTRSIRRASAGWSGTRAGAALAMLVAVIGVYGLTSSSTFAYTRIQVDGADLTDPAAVEAAVAGVRGQNLFEIRAAPLAAAIAKLPTVESAAVSIRLPDTLAVGLDERVPILIWQVGARRYLADPDGNLFALLGDQPPASTASLPVIDDQRAPSAGLSIGQTLDSVDLDAATRLASLHPADVGSTAADLSVSITDDDGFVVRARPAAWTAIFGFYTPSLRTTDLIPGQVRLLRSLLADREPSVGRIVLASDTDGTYVPRASTKPSPSASKKP